MREVRGVHSKMVGGSTAIIRGGAFGVRTARMREGRRGRVIVNSWSSRLPPSLTPPSPHLCFDRRHLRPQLLVLLPESVALVGQLRQRERPRRGGIQVSVEVVFVTAHVTEELRSSLGRSRIRELVLLSASPRQCLRWQRRCELAVCPACGDTPAALPAAQTQLWLGVPLHSLSESAV